MLAILFYNTMPMLPAQALLNLKPDVLMKYLYKLVILLYILFVILTYSLPLAEVKNKIHWTFLKEKLTVKLTDTMLIFKKTCDSWILHFLPVNFNWHLLDLYHQ